MSQTSIFMALCEQNIERERHRRQFKTIKNLRIINWVCVFFDGGCRRPQLHKNTNSLKYHCLAHMYTHFLHGYERDGKRGIWRGKSRLRDKFE
jgi:hypothetical protein